MNQKEILKSRIFACCNEIPLEEINIEIPKDKSHGDFSSNIALKLASKRKESPLDIAKEIEEKIEKTGIERIEIAPPGFINFFLEKNWLRNVIWEVIEKKENYGRSTIGENKKINLEFVSVNPTGIIHLGHARCACFGDSLANILDFAGYNTTREYYINDAGNQMINMAKSIKERYKEQCGYESHMGENYYYGKEIIAIAQKLYEEKKDGYLDAPIEFFKEIGLKTFVNQIKEDLQKARVHFDIWTSEQRIRDEKKVEEALEKLKEKNYTYTMDDALWLKTTLFGDEKDRVLIKKDGSYTYFTPDIAYHLDKLSRNYDQLIDVLGADHHGYIGRIKAAVQMFGNDKDKLEVEIIQMVRAIKDNQEYKISKRTGKTITMSDLIDEVGLDAIRYFFIERSVNSQMDFNIDLALSKTNENPVYYIQYAHARICSILNSYPIKQDENRPTLETITHEDAYNVLAKIAQFKEVVEQSAKKRMPHMIANYAYELANLFHAYYAKEKIITTDEKFTKDHILLLQAIKITIQNALRLIGVASPEKM